MFLVAEITGIMEVVMVELVPAIPDQEAGLVQFAPTPTFRVSKPKRIILCALHSFHHQNLNSEQSDNFICDQCKATKDLYQEDPVDSLPVLILVVLSGNCHNIKVL